MIVGMAVSTPAAKKLGALGTSIKASGAPPSPEQSASSGGCSIASSWPQRS